MENKFYSQLEASLSDKKDKFFAISDSDKWTLLLLLLSECKETEIKLTKALELAREALSYEIGFIEANHCNVEDKQLLLDKQALKAIEEALK